MRRTSFLTDDELSYNKPPSQKYLMDHRHGEPHTTDQGVRGSLNALAFSATIHCFIGCAIGEVLGMVVGTAQNWNNSTTIAVSIVLAFAFGYAFTLGPLLKGGVQLQCALAVKAVNDVFRRYGPTAHRGNILKPDVGPDMEDVRRLVRLLPLLG